MRCKKNLGSIKKGCILDRKSRGKLIQNALKLNTFDEKVDQF